MDGNRRWAALRGMPPAAGHRAGLSALKGLLSRYADVRERLGVAHLVFYAFSTENWNRDEEEVSALMGLFAEGLAEVQKALPTPAPRIRFIGDHSRFSEDLRARMIELQQETADGEGTVAFALSYGGRDEIVRAARRAGPDTDEASFAALLDTAGVPDPDLIIRTGGERRLSNFLLYQGAYAELFFLEKLWPDMTYEDLGATLREYTARTRRYGT